METHRDLFLERTSQKYRSLKVAKAGYDQPYRTRWLGSDMPQRFCGKRIAIWYIQRHTRCRKHHVADI